jgi:guanylate kinase
MSIGRIVILSGPSGSGKTSLYQRLLKNPKFKGKLIKSISMTTRPCRPGELHGQDYFFIDKKAFLDKRKRGLLLESQKVFNYYYGTPLKKVEQILKRGQSILLCIDVKGAKSVWRRYPDAIKIFIKTPTIAELKKRLKGRGTENKKDFAVRLSNARKELKMAKLYDFIVNNDKFNVAYKKLEKIISTELKIC